MRKQLAKYLFNEGIYQFSEDPKILTPSIATAINSTDSNQKGRDQKKEIKHKKRFDVKKTMICLDLSEPNFSAQQNEFLNKILESVKLSENDYAILFKEDIAGFVNQFTGVKNILLFGVHPTYLKLNGAHFIKYELQQYKTMNILYVDVLETISKKVEAKKALWFSLKRLYNI